MKKQKFKKNNLIEILIKKANGFFYTEEQLEYEKTQKRNKNTEKYSQKIENISFFDNPDRGMIQNQKLYDKIDLSNEQKHTYNENNEDLTLVKKKVATHYIPPDMLSIKILFEIFGKEVNENSVENLSDNQLIELKNKLISELSNENKNN